MPTGTTYKPTRINDFEATKLNFAAQGVAAAPTFGTTTNIDLLLTDDSLLTGAWLVVSGGTIGDYATFQVVDISGSFTGTPNTIVNTFITTWYLPVSANTQFDVAYPAKIYAGLTLRLIYHSTGLITPFAAINYKLHKVLI